MAQRTASTTLRNSTSAPVAGTLHHATVMDFDGRIEQVAAERAQPRQRAVLGGTGKLAVADNICRQNSGQFPVFAMAVPSPHARLARLVVGLDRLFRLDDD